ncbi:M56 family metallopeptidase [Pedobacter antarcticus]|uniref:M56 family metallopeptidase n=1 Tax=Pedobacter antarcticus TaxID=34086 RepID=UPI00087E746F|nr:M56 family metallopeptidase [Pedobacter antarcticus]SDL79954.1 BlaR1 peptidase M56 [Pedobacter antarcticus]
MELLIKAIGFTLLHSLWQGLLLSLITALILVGGKNLSSASRYRFLTWSLVLFASATLFTFASYMIQDQSIVGPVMSHQANVGIPAVDTLQGKYSPAESGVYELSAFAANGINTAGDFFSRNTDLIVLVWFLMFCAKSLQLLTGLHGIYRLKNTNVKPVSEFWQNKAEELAEKLNVQAVVRLMESGLARVPMVIGHFKPVILIPIGLINAMSTADVEAILVHELAHIRRRDFIVNILQSLLEMIFFFNPAVIWISELIRAERENCCDDIAVTQLSNKAVYIRALVSCQEYEHGAPGLSMALKNGQGQLMHRVKRLLGQYQSPVTKMERVILSLLMIVVILTTAAFKVLPERAAVKTKLASKEVSATKAQPVANQDHSDANRDQQVSSTTEHQVVTTTTTVRPDNPVDVAAEIPVVADVPVQETVAIPVKPALPVVPGMSPAVVALPAQKSDRVNSEALIADLKKHNMIEDDRDFKIQLNQDGLYIDGKKQSAVWHKRVMRNYVNEPNKKLNYTTTVRIN